MTVVLKPNLVMTSKPEEAIITHPALVAAVGEVCAACRREGFDCGKSRRALYAYDDEGGLPGMRLYGYGRGMRFFPLYGL